MTEMASNTRRDMLLRTRVAFRALVVVLVSFSL